MTTSTHDDFRRRAYALLARGVREDLAEELRWCGNMSLIAEVERASERASGADIASLNAEWDQRHP